MSFILRKNYDGYTASIEFDIPSYSSDTNKIKIMENNKEQKELKINIPEGFEIDKENSTFEKIIFKKTKKKLPCSWEELEQIEGYYITSYSCSSIRLKENCNSHNKNVFPTLEESEAVLAMAQLCQLRDAWNEGWKPNWNDYNEIKYVIIPRNNVISTATYSNINTWLCFKTPQLRDDFLNTFLSLIKQAKTFL